MAVAEQSLSRIIEAGRKRVQDTLSVIQEEVLNRKDFIVAPSYVSLEYSDGTFYLVTPEGKGRLTSWSKNQFFQKAGIPVKFANKLIGYELHDTLYMLVKALLPKESPSGLMIRQVRDTIKGVLSTKYKRFDSMLLIESFIKSCMEETYMPYEASVSDTSYYFSFIYPQVVSIDGDQVVFMLNMQTSDYGANALKIEAGVLRVVCQNGMVGYNLFKHVHLGRRFYIGEETAIHHLLSDETLELDTRTVASAIRDVIKASITAFDNIRLAVEEASEKELSNEKAKAILEALKKDGRITKEVYETALTMYKSPMPVEVLPQENTVWRLSNVLAYLANTKKEKDYDEAIELERLAWDVLQAQL